MVAITAWLTTYGYLAVFLLVAIEGPIVTIIAGSLASINVLNLYVALVVIIIGDLFADTIYYLIGRFSRHRSVEKIGTFLGFTPERTQKLESHFHQNAGRTLLLGKISHGLGGIFLVAAGMAKVPYPKFLWFNFIATVIKSIILILVGYYFGRAIVELNKGISYISIAVLAIAILMLAGYLIVQNKTKKIV